MPTCLLHGVRQDMAIIRPVNYSLLCAILQELIYSFWERIAADVLQPDLSEGLQPYITQMLGLHKAGGNLTCTLILAYSCSNIRS